MRPLHHTLFKARGKSRDKHRQMLFILQSRGQREWTLRSDGPRLRNLCCTTLVCVSAAGKAGMVLPLGGYCEEQNNAETALAELGAHRRSSMML